MPRQAGCVRTWVPSAGEEFEDCLYLMTPETRRFTSEDPLGLPLGLSR